MGAELSDGLRECTRSCAGRHQQYTSLRKLFSVSRCFDHIAAENAAQGDTQTEPPIVNAVKHCVDVVHNTKSGDVVTLFYKEFDAFYNPSSGRVKNNAFRVGDQQALFAFNKCMTEQGFPWKDTAPHK